jgi:hypothetical protein
MAATMQDKDISGNTITTHAEKTIPDSPKVYQSEPQGTDTPAWLSISRYEPRMNRAARRALKRRKTK